MRRPVKCRARPSAPSTSSRAFPTRCRRRARCAGSRRCPLPQWKGTRDATQFGPACVQPKPRPGSIYAWDLPPMSEDCLSLNIWAPAEARKAPVFVWIHGGALSGGAGSEPMYDGTQLRRARRRRRDDQLPPRRARLSRASRVERRVAAERLGQLRPARSDRGAALGEAEHRGVRRRRLRTSRSPANPPAA